MMPTSIVKCFVILMMITVAAASAATKQFTCPSSKKCGEVRGIIRDYYGAVIPDVVIVFSGEGGVHTVVSSGTGEFKLDLPVSEYRVTVKRGPFDPYEQKRFRVKASKVHRLNVTLQLDEKKYPLIHE